VRAGMPEAFDGLDDTDPAVLAAVASVRRECSEAKEALSSDTEVSIPVLLPGSQGSVRLHRSEFEALIRPQIEETVAALRRAVASAGLTPDQLTAVLLVGGSSRIPLVAQLVSEQLGRPVAVDAAPKNAIAMGAALSLDPMALAGTGPHVPAPRSGSPAPVGARATGTQRAAVSGSGMGTAGGALPPGGGSAAFRPPGPPLPRVGGEMATPVVPPPRPMAPYPERPRMEQLEVTEYREDPYDRPEPPRRRSGAFLVTVGGLAGALGIVATVFLMPAATPEPAASTDLTVPVLPAPSTEVLETTTPTEAAPPPADDAPEPNRPTTTRRPVPPPVTTDPVVPTTDPTTPTTDPTTTTTTTTTSTVEPPPDPPPVDPASAGGGGPQP
ncbi:MAG: Hsp70 family protein, partial [Pseudonocardia sp.]|nr:Hsp70 family protein [Pseudonocardia sp.]